MRTHPVRLWPSVWCCALALVATAGCGGGTPSGVDGGSDAASHDDAATGDAPGRAVIEIYVEGDPSPKTFTDGYSGQTPRDFVVGLSRFDLLRAADDADPVTVFDVSPGYLEVDLSTKSLVGTGHTADIPAGSYSHGRVLLTMARFTVDATAHSGSTSLAGTMTVLDVLSDATIDGADFTKGQGQLKFESSTYSNTSAYAMPPLPDTPGGTIVNDGPRTWMVFPFPLPMAIDPSDQATHKATIVYETFEAFRWEERQLTGYATGVWDVNVVMAEAEAVKGSGMTGYRLETE